MEALAAEAQALTALEAQLRTELRGLREQREEAEATLHARTAERDEGKRREARNQAQLREEAAMAAEVAAAEEEFAELRRNFAAQRIARAWYESRAPPTTCAGVVVSASPSCWASAVSSQRAGASLKSTLAKGNDGARLRLLEKLWAILGNVGAVLAGAVSLPDGEAVRAALEAAGYPDPSEEELSAVSAALEKDLERLRWDDAQLQARRARLSHAALSSGRGSVDRCVCVCVFVCVCVCVCV